MSTPRLLLEGSPRDPAVVVRSRLWGFNGIGFFDGDAAFVVDPGLAPEEIAALGQALATRARRGSPRRVTHVVLTHSHHDHIRGWQRFPGATVTFPRVAAAKGERARDRILAAKRRIDERLGVEDPGFGYPEPDLVFEDRARLSVGTLEVELRFLPGHSDCTSVVWIPALATLCSADYLVSPGLPYCRWRAREFEAALAHMARFVRDEGVERVLPAHNDPILGRDGILAALEREREYFRVLRAAVRRALQAGAQGERCAREAARAMVAWRGVDLGARQRQDVDNARRVIEEEAPG